MPVARRAARQARGRGLGDRSRLRRRSSAGRRRRRDGTRHASGRASCTAEPSCPRQKSAEDLGVDLRLRLAAHRAGDDRQATVAADHDRHQRVQRPLAAGEQVRRLGIEAEAGAAVVGDDAGRRLQDRGAEAVVDALDDRDRPAVRVGGDAGDGVAGGGAGRRAPASAVGRRLSASARRTLDAAGREVRRRPSSPSSGTSWGRGSQRCRSRSSLVRRKSRARAPAAGPSGSGGASSPRSPAMSSSAAGAAAGRSPASWAAPSGSRGRRPRRARGSTTSVACAARSSVVITPPRGAQAGDVARAELAAVEGGDAVAAIVSSDAASAGWRKTSPSASGRAPSSRRPEEHVAQPRVGGEQLGLPGEGRGERARDGAAVAAYAIAGRSRRAKSRAPPRPRSVSQAASTPGTVTVCGPRTGMPVRVTGAGSRSRAARTRAASSAAGAAPLPLTPSPCRPARARGRSRRRRSSTCAGRRRSASRRPRGRRRRRCRRRRRPRGRLRSPPCAASPGRACGVGRSCSLASRLPPGLAMRARRPSRPVLFPARRGRALAFAPAAPRRRPRAPCSPCASSRRRAPRTAVPAGGGPGEGE